MICVVIYSHNDIDKLAQVKSSSVYARNSKDANMKVLINSLWKLDFLQWIKVKNIKEKCIYGEKGFMKNLSIQPTFSGTWLDFSEFPYK